MIFSLVLFWSWWVGFALLVRFCRVCNIHICLGSDPTTTTVHEAPPPCARTYVSGKLDYSCRRTGGRSTPDRRKFCLSHPGSPPGSENNKPCGCTYWYFKFPSPVSFASRRKGSMSPLVSCDRLLYCTFLENAMQNALVDCWPFPCCFGQQPLTDSKRHPHQFRCNFNPAAYDWYLFVRATVGMVPAMKMDEKKM